MVYIQYMTNTRTPMQDELAAVIKDFTDAMHDRHEGDSYAAGYFSALVRQFGERDPKVARDIIEQLTFTMETYK